MPPLEKQCSQCKQILSASFFDKDKSKSTNLRSSCKQCKKNNERRNPFLKQTADMTGSARRRAKQKNLPFDIDNDYIRSIAPSHCPIFNIPLNWSIRRGSQTGGLPDSPSLDRIDPERGYVKGNVWIISFRANTIKNDATHEELKLVTKAVGEAIVNSLEF